MVAPPLVSSVYQVTTFGLLAGQPCDHVINYVVGSGTSGPDLVNQAFVNSDVQYWMAQMGASLGPHYTHTSSRSVYLGSLAFAPQTKQAGGVGTATGTYSTFASCVTVRHPVALRGRGKQGRTNIPGPAAEDIDQADGTITLGARNRYLTAWNAYNAGVQQGVQLVTGSTVDLVILNRKAGTFVLPAPSFVDLHPNTHRRWQKRLSRHR